METTIDPVIYLAPLQESTDFAYRRAHSVHFGGVDKYFSPYLVRQKDGSIKKSHQRDLSPANCEGYTLIPQIMAGNSEDFLFLANYIYDLGYPEINWNLGCPYPMVTNKGMGSGLLSEPDKVRRILDQVLPQLKCRLSVKMRSGLAVSEELIPILHLFNEYTLSEVIIHPRTARQMYNGTPDHELFAEAKKVSRTPVVYNGDLLTSGDFKSLQSLFAPQSVWMIGRGILKNPFLAGEIKGVQLQPKTLNIAAMESFHEEMLANYAGILSGQGHLLTRMTKFWEYFCFSFPDPHKAFKRVKKAVNNSKYELAVRENFLQLRNEE